MEDIFGRAFLLRSHAMTIILIGCMVSLSFELKAQYAIVSGGGSFSGHDEAISFSIGQQFYDVFRGDDAAVYMGVHQIVSVAVLGLNEDVFSKSALIYPNPVQGILNVQVISSVTGFSYGLYNMTGVLLKAGEHQRNNEVIDLSEFGPSIYVLMVFQGTLSLGTYRVVVK